MMSLNYIKEKATAVTMNINNLQHKQKPTPHAYECKVMPLTTEHSLHAYV